MMTRSISLRLGVMFGLSTALISIAAGIALFLQQCAEFDRHTSQELHGRYVLVARMAAYNENEIDWKKLAEKFADVSSIDRGLQFIVDSGDPNFHIGPGGEAQIRFTQTKLGFDRVRIGDQTFSTYAGEIPARGRRPNVRLIIALDQRPLDEALTALAAGILGTTLLAVTAASALGWWLARRGLKPVDRLSADARRLGDGDLNLRLPAQGLPSELSGLVLSFNGALDRLQQSHQKLSDFNADVAHELRTPLANLIGETELALTRSRSVEDLEQVFRSNLEELNRLRSIINDMLFLARADAGDVVDNLVLAELAEECKRTVAFMEVLFDDAGTTVKIEGDASCWLERSLVGRAISNLLDNALRHGVRGGEVLVKVRSLGAKVLVSVTNKGPPIPTHALPRVFDRFYCADPSRRSDGQTHGLGLAIVKAVARMHGGTVSAENGEGEVTVGFTLAYRPKAGFH